MSLQGWVETLIATQGDGVAVANTVTETTLLPSHASIFLPSDAFGLAGKSLEIEAWGRCSTVVTTPGTLTLRVKLGGTGAGGTAVASTGAIALTTTAQTNDTFRLKWLLQARTPGSACQLMNVGQFTSGILNNSVTAPADLLFPATAPVVGTAFDSRLAQQFDLTAQWSVANAANSIQLHMLTAKYLN